MASKVKRPKTLELAESPKDHEQSLRDGSVPEESHFLRSRKASKGKSRPLLGDSPSCRSKKASLRKSRPLPEGSPLLGSRHASPVRGRHSFFSPEESSFLQSSQASPGISPEGVIWDSRSPRHTMIKTPNRVSTPQVPRLISKVCLQAKHLDTEDDTPLVIHRLPRRMMPKDEFCGKSAKSDDSCSIRNLRSLMVQFDEPKLEMKPDAESVSMDDSMDDILIQSTQEVEGEELFPNGDESLDEMMIQCTQEAEQAFVSRSELSLENKENILLARPDNAKAEVIADLFGDSEDESIVILVAEEAEEICATQTLFEQSFESA